MMTTMTLTTTPAKDQRWYGEEAGLHELCTELYTGELKNTRLRGTGLHVLMDSVNINEV